MRNKTRIYSRLSALLVVFSLGFLSACNNAEKKEPEVKPETTIKEATPPDTPQAKPDIIDTTGIIKPVIPPN